MASRWSAAAARCVRAAGLVGLCARSRGSRATTIALVDGVVDRAHPSLSAAEIEIVDRTRAASVEARAHATFVASILAGAGPDCLGLVPHARLLAIAAVDDAMLAGAEAPRASAVRLAAALDLK